MPLPALRLTIAAPLAELAGVVIMTAVAVVFFGARNATLTQRMIELQALGLWVGPIAGFLCCLLGGWWVARRVGVAHERSGIALGVAVAILDVLLLIVSGAPIGALMALSIAARIAGGYCGGRLARHRSARSAVA